MWMDLDAPLALCNRGHDTDDELMGEGEVESSKPKHSETCGRFSAIVGKTKSIQQKKKKI